jgi:hypothetical protein
MSVLQEHEARAVEVAAQSLDQYLCRESTAHFASPGWMASVTAWVEERLASLGIRLTGQWAQFGFGSQYALLRFETDSRAVWFKTSGTSLREFNVMKALSPLMPSLFAPVVGLKQEWGAFLTLEAAGDTLDRMADPKRWLNAAKGLGTLQSRFCGEEQHLRRLGCIDWTPDRVVHMIPAFFESMTEIMGQQPPSSRTEPLSHIQLNTLKEGVQQICDRIFSLRTPMTLNNLDFNPTNIISESDHTVFIDWALATAAHPLVSLEFLIANMGVAQPALRWTVPHMRAAYCRAIRQGARLESIEEQLCLSPVLAEYLYALNCWSSARQSGNYSVNALLRSLTRRMSRDLGCLRQKEAM